MSQEAGECGNLMRRSKSSIFWDMTPCSPLELNWCFRGTYRLHLRGKRISQARNQRGPRSKHSSCSAYSLTLQTEAIYSSETSVDTQRTTQRYIPEDGTLHKYRCENLKSYIMRSLIGTIVFWDMLPYSLLESYQCFGGSVPSIFKV
jgi:hypothetical protein